MTPALDIVLGLFFLMGGGFVVFQGIRLRKGADPAKPLPTFFRVAFVIHAGIALVGIFLIARGLLSLGGGA